MMLIIKIIDNELIDKDAKIDDDNDDKENIKSKINNKVIEFKNNKSLNNYKCVNCNSIFTRTNSLKRQLINNCKKESLSKLNEININNGHTILL